MEYGGASHNMCDRQDFISLFKAGYNNKDG
jgi:hypothetical protein